MKVFVSTSPFCEYSDEPKRLLGRLGVSIDVNPFGRRLTEDELTGVIGSYDALIAGTEPITARVISAGKNLKIISRVGIGLDSVDLNACRASSILVTYTPDAPSRSVSELTIGLMLNLVRHINLANISNRAGRWQRFMGKALCDLNIGIVGYGRIGRMVALYLHGLGVRVIKVLEIENESCALAKSEGFELVNEWGDFKGCDIVSLHVPLTSRTRGSVLLSDLRTLGQQAFLINTARGGIVDEGDLFMALNNGLIAGAAIDVFEQEPYYGALRTLDNCILTSHMGSMTSLGRSQMELEATKAVVAFLSGAEVNGIVPESEYEIQAHL